MLFETEHTVSALDVETARQDPAALDVEALDRVELVEPVGREQLRVGLDDGKQALVVLLLGLGHANLLCGRGGRPRFRAARWGCQCVCARAGVRGTTADVPWIDVPLSSSTCSGLQNMGVSNSVGMTSIKKGDGGRRQLEQQKVESRDGRGGDAPR